VQTEVRLARIKYVDSCFLPPTNIHSLQSFIRMPNIFSEHVPVKPTVGSSKRNEKNPTSERTTTKSSVIQEVVVIAHGDTIGYNTWYKLSAFSIDKQYLLISLTTMFAIKNVLIVAMMAMASPATAFAPSQGFARHNSVVKVRRLSALFLCPSVTTRPCTHATAISLYIYIYIFLYLLFQKIGCRE
jgi:hypothetical protein